MLNKNLIVIWGADYHGALDDDGNEHHLFDGIYYVFEYGDIPDDQENGWASKGPVGDALALVDLSDQEIYVASVHATYRLPVFPDKMSDKESNDKLGLFCCRLTAASTVPSIGKFSALDAFRKFLIG